MLPIIKKYLFKGKKKPFLKKNLNMNILCDHLFCFLNALVASGTINLKRWLAVKFFKRISWNLSQLLKKHSWVFLFFVNVDFFCLFVCLSLFFVFFHLHFCVNFILFFVRKVMFVLFIYLFC